MSLLVILGRVQPVLEVDKVISMANDYVESIEKRKIPQKFNVARIAELYESAKNLKAQIRHAEKMKEENSNKVQLMLKSLKEDTVNTAEIKELRETGKNLREELRTSNLKFNNVNDELIELILSLPNILDPMTPFDKAERLRGVSPTPGVKHWTKPANLQWDNIPSKFSFCLMNRQTLKVGLPPYSLRDEFLPTLFESWWWQPFNYNWIILSLCHVNYV